MVHVLLRGWARLRRFFHCLSYFHRSEDLYLGPAIVKIGCECGRCFWRVDLSDLKRTDRAE